MASKDVKEKEKIKTKQFRLRKPHLGKNIGDLVEVGPKAEKSLKLKNII